MNTFPSGRTAASKRIPILVDASGRLIISGGDVTTPIPVAGGLLTVENSFTRPADTTGYAINDAIANATSTPVVQSFPVAVWNNADPGFILSARAMTGVTAFATTLRMHLFSVAPTGINDNAVLTLLWANRSNRLGYIDFGGWQTGGTGSDAAESFAAGVNIPFTAGAGSKVIYYLLEARAAFTPASAQTFYFQLQIGRP